MFCETGTGPVWQLQGEKQLSGLKELKEVRS